jgi:hypothetical protein
VLLVGAASVGENLCIGPISGDWGATAVHASQRRCLLLGRAWLRDAELPSQCCVAQLGCRLGALAKARCTAGQRLVGRLSVPS